MSRVPNPPNQKRVSQLADAMRAQGPSARSWAIERLRIELDLAEPEAIHAFVVDLIDALDQVDHERTSRIIGAASVDPQHGNSGPGGPVFPVGDK